MELGSTAPVVAFFDVDGTLTSRDFNDGMHITPTPRVCEAIRAFAAAGNVPVISTGRGMQGIADLLDLPFSGFVTLDGTHVIYDGKVIYSRPIPDDVFRQTVDEVRRTGMDVLLEGPYGACVIATGEYAEELKLPQLEDYVRDGGRTVFSKVDFADPALEGFRKSDYLQERYEYMNVGDGFHELIMPGEGKGVGARALLAELPFEPSRVFVFGDSENDLSILEVADVAVVMGNARDVVKKRADYVTDHVNDDGVATALEHFGLI